MLTIPGDRFTFLSALITDFDPCQISQEFIGLDFDEIWCAGL